MQSAVSWIPVQCEHLSVSGRWRTWSASSCRRSRNISCVKMWETGRSLEPGSLITSSTPCISETYSVFSPARVTWQASCGAELVIGLDNQEKNLSGAHPEFERVVVWARQVPGNQLKGICRAMGNADIDGRDSMRTETKRAACSIC